jgi:nitrate reductase NapD
MNVCGVLVHAHPQRIDTLEAALVGIPGVESYGRAQGTRLIVTAEDTPTMTAADALAEINKLPGVIAAALVYHEFDPEI